MQTITLRQAFLNYFRVKQHKYLPQSAVFNNDPTLLFVNSGMCQLKDIFLGQTEPKDGNTKLMNSQICIRAGGKHNDLDDVGHDSYHLTSFEMLGNWSLNDYGKEEAIVLAYNFLIQECKLNKDQMYVTYYEGNDIIPADLETFNIWKKLIPESRIVKGSHKDNFWQMADNGPCGVSTEIHYDLIGNRDASKLINKNDPTVIEIWNLVFMQYNKDGDKYTKLGKFYVDTGMGLERLSMVLQNKKTLYQTDAFRYLLGYAQALSNSEFFTDQYNNHIDTAYRVFADHMRTCVIALYQGVDFDCNKRGFILRKIYRRLLNYFYIYLSNGYIRQIMIHPMIKCMISDILNYYLFKTHDADSLWNKLTTEENMYISKLMTVDRKYKKCLRKSNDTEQTIHKLKAEFGIDGLIISNLNIIRFQ